MCHRWASRRAPCEARGLRGKLNRSSHSQGLTRGGGQACKLTFGKEDAARTGPAVLRGGAARASVCGGLGPQPPGVHRGGDVR